MRKVGTILGAAAMYLGACATTLGSYERTRCDFQNRVTELVDGNGTSSPFDDRVISIISTEENHPDCIREDNRSDSDRETPKVDRPTGPVFQ